MDRYKQIERSIIKKFRKDIWSRFIEAINKYKLIEENDNIMVCISGGKDSFLLAKCIQEVLRHGKINFKTHFVVMNPGYNDYNLKKIKENANILNIDIEIFNSDIFDIVNNMEKSPCYLCAKMRRGYLYAKAKELGCNKIALGHHFDDVIETTLLSMFYGAEIRTMMPKLHSEHFEGLQLIRPLCLVKESAIISWSEYNNIDFINCACRFTESCIQDDKQSKRIAMKKLINKFREENKNIDYNIYKSLDNVNLNCVLGTKKDGIYESFIEKYDK